MADHFTTRLAIPYPDIDDPADVPADMQQLAERLDVLIAPSGAQGALNRIAVGDVGMAGQIRAGRQLTAADFTALGLSAPVGLWNLSDLSDASGNNRPLTNKGAVAFVPGINGVAATAAQFTGSTAQALYRADTGAADPFRLATGSWGCWFRTAKRGVVQTLMSKRGAPGQYGWNSYVSTGNAVNSWISLDGNTLQQSAGGVSDVADDRWHLHVIVSDGAISRTYVDGLLEATFTVGGITFPSSGPLNIGTEAADAATVGSNPHFGRVDEAFVTADVLSDEQVRALYCARIPHTVGAVPSSVKLNVTRRRRGGTLAVADFPAAPLRLHNFTGASLADEGSGGVALVNATPTLIVPVGGADGATGNAFSFAGAHTGLAATDAGLPSVLASRSYGCWFKTAVTIGGNFGIVSWGTAGTRNILFISNGQVAAVSANDQITGPFAADGQWHHAVVIEDNAAGDGIRRKLYLDGRLVGGSTVMGSFALGGASRFRVGADADGTLAFTGQIDGAFVCAQVLTFAQIAALYAKGSQALAPSPKSPGDHVEAWDAAAVYATFDTLDSSAQIDLGVSA